MLNIQKFVVNMVQENCYILSDETREAAIIDDGAYYHEEQEAIELYMESNQLKPVVLLDTHAHFDHILGNKALFDRYGLKARFSKADAGIYEAPSLQIQSFLRSKLDDVESAPAGNFIGDGDLIKFGNHTIEVISTPGHTPGGLCFYLKDEKVLFSGDSLFQGSIGRTDFPGGNGVMLVEMLKEKVLTLPDDVKVFPGHGPATDIKTERTSNIYFK